MKNIFLRNWSFSRILRFGIGILLAMQAYQVEQWWFMAFGGFFMLTALFNISTCPGSNCSVPNRNRH